MKKQRNAIEYNGKLKYETEQNHSWSRTKWYDRKREAMTKIHDKEGILPCEQQLSPTINSKMTEPSENIILIIDKELILILSANYFNVDGCISVNGKPWSKANKGGSTAEQAGGTRPEKVRS